jgi:acetolactate synthase-1/2/3 large subunit
MQALKQDGYSTCFFVGGGNSMHLLESASRLFDCVPVVHEVTAAIAAEYFNQSAKGKNRAFVLVTAGPGLTNLITGIAGAWLDSRELLVIGGQAKSTNLSKGTVRQIGHQEIDGVSITKSITKVAQTIEQPVNQDLIHELISQSWSERPGPVFIEVCLDVSAMEYKEAPSLQKIELNKNTNISNFEWEAEVIDLLKNSKRPLLLLGGGVSRDAAKKLQAQAKENLIPIACTWTGADRCGFDYPYYAGRPNTYGMRWANIFQQQCDLIIAIGTSLGFQQTGFNTAEYAPNARIIHVDIDKAELNKPNPKKRFTIQSESTLFISEFIKILRELNKKYSEGITLLEKIRANIPVIEECQKSDSSYLSPYLVINRVSQIAEAHDSVIAASSGGTFTATMQAFENKNEQILIGNKGLASMGYGLGGAIGIAIEKKGSRGKTILFEGDGGFAQNLQELGTVVANNLNLKIFITCNDGYASIRTSQKTYFNGHYIGCDTATGLSLPNWKKIAEAFGIPVVKLTKSDFMNDEFMKLWNSQSSCIFLIMADPNQMYLPKIMSKFSNDGSMVSRPLHDMYPKLQKEIEVEVFQYLPENLMPTNFE